MGIRRKLVPILPTPQPNRVLVHKPTRIRLIVPEEVVMQSRFKVVPSERLIHILVNPLVLFQKTPAGVVAESQEVAVDVGHFSWNADLVAVEVVGLLSAFLKISALTSWSCRS